MENEATSRGAHDYLDTYVAQAQIQAGQDTNPLWMRIFFDNFATNLEQRKNDEKRSKGDRYVVTRPFADALKECLKQSGVECELEQPLSKYVSESAVKSFPLLKRKRVDFSVKRGGALVLIEYKTNLSFNDISAAMAEMLLVKKYATSEKILTAALFLYPASGSIAMFSTLNTIMGSALDAIWVLGRGTKASYEYDLQAFETMHNDILNFLR
jgi:hypothetical protein